MSVCSCVCNGKTMHATVGQPIRLVVYKAGYRATPVSPVTCTWAEAVSEVTRAFGQEQ